LDHRLNRGSIGDVAAHSHAADLARRLLSSFEVGTVVHDHPGAHRRQRLRDGAADPLATPGDQSGTAIQVAGHANSTKSSSAFQVSTPGRCFAARLAKTRPGPSSTTVETFIAFSETIVRAQSTGRRRWLASSCRRSLSEATACPVAFARIGNL